MYNTLVVTIDELWLKGKNRPFYFKKMKDNIKLLLNEVHPESFYIKKVDQRLVVESDSNFDVDTIRLLTHQPGIHSVSPAKSIDSEMDKISESIFEILKKEELNAKTFKIRTKRSDKRFSLNSMEVSKELGHQVLVKFPELKVDVHKPDIFIDVRILNDATYISIKKLLGPGGLPVGTSGHLVTLISGGFDSPVASFMMSKRGCKQTFMFFYAYPFVDKEVKEKILEIMKVLATYQAGCDLYIVPFGDFQNDLSKNIREEYRTILFRRYMIKVASLLAKEIAADAILTGDALGQVSSQTIKNITVMDDLSDITIFRPLLGLNKMEIIEISKRINLYEVSSRPHDDACSMFAPAHPIIKADKYYLEKFETEFSNEDQIKQMITDSEVYRFTMSGDCKKIDC